MEQSILFTPDIDDRTLDREVRDVNDQLNDAGTINPEIGDVQGDLDMGSLSMGGGGGLSGGGPRSPLRRMSRGVDNLVPMADYRNRLLEDILDAVQGGRGGGGDRGNMLRNLLGLGAIGGLAVSALSSVLSDISVSDIVGTGLDLGEGALRFLIDSGLDLGVGALDWFVSSGLEVGADALGYLISAGLDVGAGVLDDLISTGYEVGAAVVNTLVSAGVNLTGAVTQVLNALIANPVVLTASQVLDHLVESGSGEAAGSEQSQPSGRIPGVESGSGEAAGSEQSQPSGRIPGVESGSGEAAGSEQSQPSGRGAGVDNGLGPLVAASSLAVGTGTLAASGFLPGTGLAASLGGGTASASITAATLATLGLGTGGVLATLLGTRELAQVASGGEGFEPATAAGRDFAQSNPGVAESIRTGFMNNPITDLGRDVGNRLNGNLGGNVDASVRRRNRQMGLSRTEAPRVQIDSNVTIDASNMQDIDREYENIKEDVKRDIQRNMSNSTRWRGP